MTTTATRTISDMGFKFARGEPILPDHKVPDTVLDGWKRLGWVETADKKKPAGGKAS